MLSVLGTKGFTFLPTQIITAFYLSMSYLARIKCKQMGLAPLSHFSIGLNRSDRTVSHRNLWMQSGLLGGKFMNGLAPDESALNWSRSPRFSLWTCPMFNAPYSHKCMNWIWESTVMPIWFSYCIMIMRCRCAHYVDVTTMNVTSVIAHGCLSIVCYWANLCSSDLYSRPQETVPSFYHILETQHHDF